jgi:hypothetical protein
MTDDDVIKVPTVATVDYNKLKQERDQWARMYLACNEREQALAQRCDRLRGALKIFADDNNWDDGDERTDYAITVWDGIESPWLIARAALAETGGQDGDNI